MASWSLMAGVGPMAKRTVLIHGYLRQSNRRWIELTHSTPGHETVGSNTRWTHEKWGVLMIVDGETRERWFKTFDDAKALLEEWISEEEV